MLYWFAIIIDLKCAFPFCFFLYFLWINILLIIKFWFIWNVELKRHSFLFKKIKRWWIEVFQFRIKLSKKLQFKPKNLKIRKEIGIQNWNHKKKKPYRWIN